MTMKFSFCFVLLLAACRVNGQSRSAFELIEAELSDGSSGTSIQSVCNGHLVVSSTNTGDYLLYDNVDFGAGAESVEVIFSDGNAFGYTGNIDFHIESATNPPFGTVVIGQTGDWCNFISMNSVLITPPGDVHNLYITFSSSTGNTVYLDNFRFNSTIF